MKYRNSQENTTNVQHRWTYQPLTADDIRQIHNTTMEVLSEVGFEVMEPEAFELFEKAGADVDREHRIVRVSESLVKELIASAPPQITLYARDEGRSDIKLGQGNVYFGTGGTALNILDYPSGQRRPANLQDLVDVVRITDQLENVHLMLLPTYPNEIDANDVDVNRFFTGLNYTSKHIMGGVYTAQGIRDVIAMAEDVAGSPEALRERPFISMITCGISPLRLDSKYGAFMIQAARESIPLAVPVEPLCGATAPVTLAGTLVIQNCDGLINIMLTQLANPGTPVIYGSVATSVNMHDVGYLGGPVESGLINAATAQLAQFYELPYYATAGISDSKTLDTQCGYETAVNALLVGMAGADFIHDAAGLMEFAVTVSKEKLVIDNDILGIALRAARGIEVNPKTLAGDVIRHAGPGGNFISERHTRRYFHKEHFVPPLTNRERREVWEQQGRKTIAERAHEKVQSILNDRPTYYLDETLRTRLLEKYPNIHFKS